MKFVFLRRRLFSYNFQNPIVRFLNRTMTNLPKIFVRHVVEEDTMKISFSYGTPEREFTFMRSIDEKLEIALFRMKHKIQNVEELKSTKKKRKSSRLATENNQDVPESLTPVKISLISPQGEVIGADLINIDAWTSGSIVTIGESDYEIVKNSPGVSLLNLPKNIMSGFPVYPKIMLEFCSKDEADFEWYRSFTKSDKQSMDTTNLTVLNIKCENWLKLSDGFFYVTKESDVGRKLRLHCLPKCGELLGKEVNTVTTNVVEAGPGRCPFEDRHAYTEELTKVGSTRCLSYNILADVYADSDTARNCLFPYCPTEALTLDYRKQLYMKEILGYNADILCFQEVDRKVFLDDLVPVLSTATLQGVFNEKGFQVAEGMSCFYRTSKFKLVCSSAIVLSDAIKTEPVLQNILLKINENEKLSERFLGRTTALQIVLLECVDVPRKRILVGNTHLYFHPKSDNIRLLQAICCIQYLEHMLKQYQEMEPSYTTSLIFCGDFNSCPEFGVYKLMTQGLLEECIDWKSNPEEEISGTTLSHSLSLDSACGTPQYTNYTAGFNGCLDYIFYDNNNLNVSDVVPLPPHEQVIEHTALPNKLFPSDHLALVCTLNWK